MDKKILIDSEWYVQGINAVPAYVAAGPLSGIFACKKVLGYNYSKFVMDFKKDYLELYYNREDLHKVYDEFWKRYQKDKNYLKWVQKKHEELKKPVLEYIKDNLNSLSKLSDDKLTEEYKKFTDMFYFCFGASHIAEAIALTTDVIIKDMLLRDLEKLGLLDKFTEFFTELTQPTMKFFFSDYNRSLSGLVKYFKKGKKQDKQIAKHIDEFYWIRSSWHMGCEYGEKEVMDEIKGVIDNKEEIRITTDDGLRENLKKKKALFKQLKLEPELIELINITDFITYLQDDRKVIILKGVYLLEQFIKEISKRKKIDAAELKYLLPDEFDNIDIDKLVRRREKSAYVYFNEELEILTGDEYDEFMSKLKKKSKEDNVGEIGGLCASLGIAIGKVKVILTVSDMGKIEKGDILVTSMTRPELVPAMKKAAAIVTDEGGITCHAAVISRELGVPCVIGTKKATKVLKDGDLVEVNANHAIVRVLK